MIEVVCRQCDKKYQTYKAWVRKGGGKFCSRLCYGSFKSKQDKDNKKWSGDNNPAKTERVKAIISKARKGKKPWNKGVKRTDKERKNISQSLKGKTAGSKNPQWKGGISKLPYDAKLTKYEKSLIYKRDNWTCQECKKYPVKYITVHHIDYNKMNSDSKNLITLCRSCNCKANFNRDIWKEKFNEAINIRYSTIAR
jgi:hypothetical protein